MGWQAYGQELPDVKPADSISSEVDIQDSLQYHYRDTIKIDTLKNQIRKDTLRKKGYKLDIHPSINPIELIIRQEPVRETSEPDLQQPPVEEIKTEKEKKEKLPKVKQPKDTVIGPSGFEIAIDYAKLITFATDFESKAEGALSFTYREKIQLLGEIGYGETSPAEAIKNGSYISKGNYGRLGITYGGEVLPKSYLYLGLMYGISQFEDEGNIIIESQALDDYDGIFIRKDLNANWFEFIIVSETEFRNNLFLGSKWRLRRLNTFDNNYNPAVYAIPGYGRTFDNTLPAVNLYIKYRFKL